jgi:hypothetical protein
MLDAQAGEEPGVGERREQQALRSMTNRPRAT